MEHIDANHPNFACENANCSNYSPGLVDNDEELAFLLINPLHYDKKLDVVVPDAFLELTRRDLSTLRVFRAKKIDFEKTKEKLIQRGMEKASAEFRFVDEICLARVNEIREAKEEGKRILAVYDTALQDVPAHASIFTRSDVMNDKFLRKKIRNRIWEIFTKNRSRFSEFINSIPD